jgi:hypothetical protein
MVIARFCAITSLFCWKMSLFRHFNSENAIDYRHFVLAIVLSKFGEVQVHCLAIGEPAGRACDALRQAAAAQLGRR